jgi:hypothetical protein
MLLTMTAVFKATLATVNRLKAIGVEIQAAETVIVPKAATGNALKTQRKELQSLAMLAEQCQSHMNSVEIMANRVSKLIDLVWHTQNCT